MVWRNRWQEPRFPVSAASIYSRHLRHPIGRERLAERGQEQRGVVSAAGQLGPHIIAIFDDPSQRPLADRQHPVLLPLALADHDRAAIGIDVVELEVDQLEAADAGGLERLEYRAVADADQRREVRHRQHLLHLFDVQDVAGQSLFDARHVQLGGRIIEDVVGLARYLKNAFSRVVNAIWVCAESG
jgi:hypothetical protein